MVFLNCGFLFKHSSLRLYALHSTLYALRSYLYAQISTLPAHRSRLYAHRSPLTSHRSPLKSHRSNLIAHRSPLTSHRSNLISHHSSLFTFWAFRMPRAALITFSVTSRESIVLKFLQKKMDLRHRKWAFVKTQSGHKLF